jgi:uncharacterized membrane protein YGL010W
MPQPQEPAMRPVDAYLDQYSADHRNATNQWIHLLCVPAIVWSVTAMLWTVPVPAALLQPGAIAAFAMVAALAWYWRLSRKLWVGIAIAFVAFAWLDWWIASAFGMRTLLVSAIAVFVVAWIGQFIGHIYEGHRPSFFTDLVFLLVGPMWTLRKLYQRLGFGY